MSLPDYIGDHPFSTDALNLMDSQDLRNHGQSFHAPDHTYSAMAEDVEEFMQQQKLDKSVLIGHSM